MRLFMKGDVVVTSVLRQYFLLIVFLLKASIVGEAHNDGATGGEGFLFLSNNANKGEKRPWCRRINSELRPF